jgi:hypothetical protein
MGRDYVVIVVLHELTAIELAHVECIIAGPWPADAIGRDARIFLETSKTLGGAG